MYAVALQRPFADINQRAADMWSFAILLWELATREVPFAELSPMEVGMKVCPSCDMQSSIALLPVSPTSVVNIFYPLECP